jgi:hypothetical protein
MADTTVHVFAGEFRDRNDACAYALDQWEPPPTASKEEYDAREDRNPTWQMRSDLGEVHLDHDFIEVIDDMEHLIRYDDLRSMLKNADDIAGILRSAGPDANILVLIFKEALGGFEALMRSTPRLSYCGEFPCTL